MLMLKDNPPTIKVRVGKDLGEIVVTGTDIKRIIHLKQSYKDYVGRKSIHFNCSKVHQLKKSKHPILLASLESPTGLLTLDQHKYKGSLHIVTSNEQTKCDVINEIDAEYYISSLLSKEMNGSWPMEALKAQAIAARSYAFYKIFLEQKAGQQSFKEMSFHLENSEKHQVSGHFFDATDTTHQAAFKTKGYILLTKNGRPFPAFFHSKCGGQTRRPEQVWSNVVQGYQSVSCPFCHHYGKKDWQYRLSKKKFFHFIQWLKKTNRISVDRSFSLKEKIMILPDSFQQTDLRFYLGQRPFRIKKSFFRKYFGRKYIHSNNFSTMQSGNNLVLRGSGKGHGVGMCQYGTLALAKKGWSYRKILSYYFPEHKIAKVY